MSERPTSRQGSIWSQAAQRPRRTSGRVPPAADADPAPNGGPAPDHGQTARPEGAEDASASEVGGEAEHQCLEFCPICRTAEVLRTSVTPEMRGQLEELQRDALLAMRSALDHYLERLDAQPSEGTRVEEIPID